MSNIFGFGTLSTEDRVTKAVIELQKEKPFFGHILLKMHEEMVGKDSPIDTFAVNAYGRLFFNEEFASKQSDAQLKYILCHEVLHLAKGDFYRRGNRIPLIWNIASDCIINDYCNQEGLTPPTDGIIPDRKGSVEVGGRKINVRGLCAEDVYDLIIDNFEQIKISIGKKGDGEGQGEGHGGFDIHLPEDIGADGEPTGDAERDASGNETNASTQQQKSQWQQSAVDAAVYAKQRGNLPGYIESLIEHLLNPRVNWKNKLRKLIVNEIPIDYTNRLPGRKFYGTGVWTPQTYRENVNIFLSVDCSGSTSGDREQFISECVGVLTAHPNVKGRLICWDTHVKEENDIEVSTQTLYKFKKFNLKDVSGGTDLSSYARHINKKGYSSNAHIVLTDGYIESKPILPNGKILFVLTKNGDDSIIKKYGEVVRIN